MKGEISIDGKALHPMSTVTFTMSDGRALRVILDRGKGIWVEALDGRMLSIEPCTQGVIKVGIKK